MFKNINHIFCNMYGTDVVVSLYLHVSTGLCDTFTFKHTRAI
jgi:hypothetical protein